MRVVIDLSDDLYAALCKRSKCAKDAKPDKAAVNTRIREILKEFNEVGSDGLRYFIVAGDDRRAIERIFETTVEDAQQLVQRVTNMSVVQVGGYHRELTDTESRLIQAQAEFWSEDVQAYLKRITDEALNVALGTW